MKGITENRYKYEFLSFCVCAITIGIYLFFVKYGYGNYNTLVDGDMLELFVVAPKSFFRALLSGEGVQFSWNNSMGMNVLPYYATWVGTSICNLLFLVPGLNIEMLVFLLVTIKIGLVGTGFYIFANRVLKVKPRTAILFCIFYAMCGQQIAVNVTNFIWLDGVMLLPLILTLIIDLFEYKKWKKLVFAYAYLFLTNFYIGYMVGFFSFFFSVCYFLFFYMHKNSNKSLGVWGKYIGIVLLSAGIGAFSLVPTAYYLLNNMPDDSSKMQELSFQFTDFLRQFLVGMEWKESAQVPYLYMGGIVCILLPLFFTNDKIELKEKLMYGLLMAIMTVSFFCMPLYLFWHGFDTPDGWPFRFSFIFSFLCICMGCKTYENQKDEKNIKLLIIAVCEVILLLLLKKRNKYVISDNIFIINLFLLVLWTVALMCRKCYGEKRKMMESLIMVGVIGEVIINSCIMRPPTTSMEEIRAWEKETKEAIELIQNNMDENEFSRVVCYNSRIANVDTYMGFNGISDFGTFENYKLRSTLARLGMYTSPRIVTSYGLNPFTQMILGVKYCVQCSGSIIIDEAIAQPYVYERFLPIGYLVDEGVKTTILNSDDPYENINQLASNMVGKKTEVFVEVDSKNIWVEENGISLLMDNDRPILYIDPDEEETMTIDYLVSNQGKPVYVTFVNGTPGLSKSDPQIFEYFNKRDTGMMGVPYTKEMFLVDNRWEVTAIMNNESTKNLFPYQRALFYMYDEEAMEDLYQYLQNGQFQVTEFKNGYLKGKVNVTEKGKILFTSIPYDLGWTVHCGQEEKEILPLLDESFVGLAFDEVGEYDVEFVYNAPGFKVGKLITLISLVVVLGCCYLERRYNKGAK